MIARAPLARPVILAASLLASSLFALGCGPVVIGGGGDDGGEVCAADALCDDEPVPTPVEPSSTSIALRYAELPPLNPGSGSSSSSGGGAGIDPDTLYISIGDLPTACHDPFAAMGCGQHWRVFIAVPPALQVPGFLSLDSPELYSNFSATGPGGGEDCYFAGGSFVDGTMEIVSIDADEVVVRLSGTATWEFAADGEYTASRCF